MTEATTPGPHSERTQGHTCSCVVLIAGGGPGGSTTATLLARKGRQVVMMEKARHPRFHIDESLLPARVRLLGRLGVRSEVEAIGMTKWFDAEGVTVDVMPNDGATQRRRAKFVVGASGRDTLLATQNRWRQKNRRYDNAALFAHFRDAECLSGKREGNVSIFWVQHGWFWFIPLADGSTSIGAVCWPHHLKQRDKPLPQLFFPDAIALAPELARRLQGAMLIDDQVRATGNCSYCASRCAGDFFLILGMPAPSLPRCFPPVFTWRCKARATAPKPRPRRWTAPRPTPPPGAASSAACSTAHDSFRSSSNA